MSDIKLFRYNHAGAIELTGKSVAIEKKNSVAYRITDGDVSRC